MNWSDYITAHILWSEHAFGPGAHTESLCRHIENEVNEIRETPADLMEWVDVMILAIDGAYRAGHTPEQIIAALVGKQAINMGRRWNRTTNGEPMEHER